MNYLLISDAPVVSVPSESSVSRQPPLEPCCSHNYGLTEGQGVVGAKRGGLRMDAYVDDERQNPRPLGPRPKGWP